MDEKYKDQIALFRYGIISPLITAGETTPTQRGRFFREAAEKKYIQPDGKIVSPSSDTIYRYYRNYQKGGFEALRPVGRSDIGVSRKLDDDIITQIKYLHKEYPRLPATIIYAKLVENGTITEGRISLSTVTRFLKKLKEEEGYTTKEMRRYELEHINEVWYGDSSVAAYLRIGKKKQKTWIIALIDDASRMIVGIDIFFNDNYVNLMSVIRSAVMKYGRPQAMKFDNGASYRSHQMELLGARMGTAIHYAPPYTPTGKAKIERWFNTCKTQWLSGLNMDDFHSLDELRESLMKYVQEYNQTVHSSLNGKTPQDRFFEESNLIVRLDQERIDKTFLLEMERHVSEDNVVSIEGENYEVDYRYAGRKILLRYSPDLTKIYTVDRKTGEMEEIHLLNKVKNSDGHRHSFMFSNAGEES